MKHYSQIILLSIFALFFCISPISSVEKTNFALTEDGAWSVNSQPSAVYHNGKTYFTWINAEKSLIVASLDHATKDYTEKVVATGFRGDFASPALLVRKNGQILLFSSKNEGEAFVYYWVSKKAEDISEWSASATGTAYGAGASLPIAVGNDVYIFYRGKNSVGVLYAAGLNSATSQTLSNISASNTRSGLYSMGNGNDYTVKLDIPYMRVCQDKDGAIHIVFTQLASGGTNNKFYNYNKSSIHYIKYIPSWNNGIKHAFYKADGSSVSSISIATPPDVIYAEETEDKKAWAYDIALDADGSPVVLYATFDADGTNHSYHYAKWDNTTSSWISSKIADAGNGLSTTAYTANQSKFPAHSLSSGGINFAGNDLSSVFLSKRSEQGIFEIYKYSTTDTGSTWNEIEAITSNTPAEEVNIRPWRIQNPPENHDFELLWMKGSYTNPTNFNTHIYTRGNSLMSGITFEKEEYEFVLGDIAKLNINFRFFSSADKSITLVSNNPNCVKIKDDGSIECLALGEASITATSVADPGKTATCKITVVEKTAFHNFAERILADMRVTKMTTPAALDAKVASSLNLLQANGSFPDVVYTATDRTDWPPMKHLDRMLEMVLAYTHEESSYFENTDLKGKIELALTYWQTAKPKSNNWYQNEIGEPHRMAPCLILMQYFGKEKISSALMTTSTNRLRDNGGDPAAQTGANRADIALHWMYRAVITKDKDLMQTAMNWLYSPVAYTTGAEGLQYDNSYTQHGRQLYIGGYGESYMSAVTKAAICAVGTEYALPAEQLNIFSHFVRDTYLKAMRGSYMFYNVMGRSVTRPGSTKRIGDITILERMKEIDPANITDYEDAIARIKEEKAVNYNITPSSVHYYKGDYTRHQRPKYAVDMRMVSTRTARNEILADNGEGLKQYFMSDGSTGIFVDGDEYYNIYPVWNWAKIPGTTTPEFTTIPKAGTYIKAGESDLAGGVTDSLYSVSVYRYADTFSNINSSANKAWFFFEDEVVCLGNSIKSTSEYKVNTTVNQTLLKGDVTVSSNGAETTLTTGAYNYNNNLDWVYHNKVAYYFPEKGKLDLSAQEQSGSWIDINTSYTQEGIATENVFSLSFDHGVAPDGEEYSYIIVPGISSVEDAKAYDPTNIEIVKNTDTVQAVYHKGLKMYGIVFYQNGGFENGDFIVETDAPCVLLVKGADQTAASVHVADPRNASTTINIGIKLPALKEAKAITYQTTSPHHGQSIMFLVNETTPTYTGKNITYDRSDWIISTNIKGPADASVYGDKPEYIIDSDSQSAFLFVKPGKTIGGITGPADYIPAFTIDMQLAQEIAFFVYRHRTYNNTQASLRASAVSFYGKNNESDEFTPIIQNQAIATDAAEVEVKLPQKVNYRYVKLEMVEWDKTTSSTIQVSEFNMGYIGSVHINNPPTNIENILSDNKSSVTLYPNPVKKGEIVNVTLPYSSKNILVKIFDITGKAVYITTETKIDTNNLNSGLYVLQAEDKTAGKKLSSKLIIK